MSFEAAIASRSLIRGSSKGSDIDDEEKTVEPEDLVFYDFYEQKELSKFQHQLLDSEQTAIEIINDVYDNAFYQIMEKYYWAKIPNNVSHSINDLLEIGLECNFKKCDEDDMDFLEECFEVDEAPVSQFILDTVLTVQESIQIDSWARGRINNAQLRDIPDCKILNKKLENIDLGIVLKGVRSKNVKEEMKKDLRDYKRKGKKFLLVSYFMMHWDNILISDSM